MRSSSRWSPLPGVLSALLLAALALLSACGEEDDGAPGPRCQELCAHNHCARDVSQTQCVSTCEEWHSLCSSEARVFVQCANTQLDDNFLCDDQVTRLADGLCVNEDRALRSCLNDRQ